MVKDSQGELLKAASIWIQMKKDSSESITHIYSPLSTSSDDSGRYIIQSIPAGEGQVFFSRRGNFRNNASQKPNVVTFIEGDTVLLDLTEPEIENAGRLEVLLSEHWNDIFNNAHLTKTQIGSPMSFSALKSKSAFVFEKVPEGTYQLQLWSAIGKFKNREVSITANQTTTLQIDEEENFTVIAKVIDAAGKPIPMGHAMLVPADAANNFMSNPYKGMGGAGKIRNGQLQISLEQPGAFKLMLMIQSGMQMRTVTLDTINIQNEGVTDLGTITIKDGGQIQGMTLQSSGEPLANVQLLILKDGLPHFNPLWLSDKNGQFLLNDVPEPPFQLIATHPTMANLTTEVNDLSALRLVMTTGVNVTVQLNGINSANRRVILVHEDLSPLISLTHYQTMSNTSDKGGKITLSKISMGQYKVCVLGEKPEQNQYSDTFTVTNADITVQMTLQN